MTLVRKHLFILLMAAAVASNAQTSSDILGNWKDNELPKRLVEFYQGDKGLYYARIVRDEDNNKLNGKIFIRELQYDEQTKIYSGMVIPPDVKADIEIKTEVTWISKDTLQVVVRNFFHTKKIQFVRIAE